MLVFTKRLKHIETKNLQRSHSRDHCKNMFLSRYIIAIRCVIRPNNLKSVCSTLRHFNVPEKRQTESCAVRSQTVIVSLTVVFYDIPGNKEQKPKTTVSLTHRDLQADFLMKV